MKKTYNRHHKDLLFPYLRLAALLVLPIGFGSRAWGQCAGALVDDAASFQWILAETGVVVGQISGRNEFQIRKQPQMKLLTIL